MAKACTRGQCQPPTECLHHARHLPCVVIMWSSQVIIYPHGETEKWSCKWRNWDSKRSSHLLNVHSDWTGSRTLVAWLQNSCLIPLCQKLLHSLCSREKTNEQTEKQSPQTFVTNDVLTHNINCEAALRSCREIFILLFSSCLQQAF